MKKIIAIILLLGAQLAFGMEPSLDAQLIDAVRNPNKTVQQITDLARRGANVNIISRGDLPILMEAIGSGAVDKVKALLAAGARLGPIEGFQFGTPLLGALLMEPVNTDIVRALVAAGADLEAVVPGSGVTPLMFAAMSGNVDAVTVLLEAGANKDAVEPNTGMTPLMGAVRIGALPAVRKLLVFIPPAERKKIREHILGLLSALKRTPIQPKSRDIRQLIGSQAFDDIVNEQMRRILVLLAQTNNNGQTAQVIARGHTAIVNFLNPNNPELRQAVVEEIKELIKETQMPPVAKK